MFHNRILAVYKQVALPRSGQVFLGALILLTAMLMFNARLAKAQDLIWVNPAGGSNSDSGNDIVTDEDGNIYVTGAFYGSATFGEGANAIMLPDSGTGSNYYIFIAKYDTNGTLVWATSAGGATLSSGAGIALGSNGELHITGFFSGDATFGEDANTVTLSSVSNSIDIFVAVYATDGTFLSAWSEGGTDSDGGEAVAIDSAGNGYVTGFYRGTATFGEGANTVTLTSSDDANMFIAKYNKGTLIWAKSADGDEGVFGYGIAIDSEANPYVIGSFNGSTTFGEGASSVSLSSSGGASDKDLYIAKYAPDGQLVWVDSAGGTSTDYGFGIALDSQDTLGITGSFSGSATFGQGSDAVTLTGTGNLDIFVARYTNRGDLMWARAATGTSDDRGNAVAVDGEGNSFITGSFKESLTFGQESDAVTLIAAGSTGVNAKTDLFLVKFDSDGNLLWARSDGGNYDVVGNGVAVDSEGAGYVIGKFTSSATFGASAAAVGQVGAAQILDETITSAGSSDAFMAKYGPSSQPLAVTLGYFSTVLGADLLEPDLLGGDPVSVHWQTATELGTAGFMLYGKLGESITPLTTELIPSISIDSVIPSDYSYRVATDAAQFYLDEHGINGSVTRYGPFALGQVYGSHVTPVNVVRQPVQFLPMVWEN